MKTSILFIALGGIILFTMYDFSAENGLILSRPEIASSSLESLKGDSMYQFNPLEARSSSCFNMGYVMPPGKVETIKFNTRDFQ